MINARRAVTQQPESIDKKEDPIHSLYMESVHLLERLHRRLLDVVKDEFERNGRSDINAVQALLLFNIGDSELTAGELRTRANVGSTEAVKQAVMSGLGASIILAEAVTHEIDTGALIGISIKGMAMKKTFFTARLKTIRDDEIATKLSRFLTG